MNTTLMILLIMLGAAITFLVMVSFGFVSGFQEDQVRICSFVEQCFLVDIDDFFNSTQSKILENPFNSINKIEHMSEADKLECYLNKSLKYELYSMEEGDN
jgi:hypothetical protein